MPGLTLTAWAACPKPSWPLETLAPEVWLARAAPGDADAGNRGRVSNLLVVRHGARVWLVGSGPSPASGQALACQLREQLGLKVTDVIAPWARPELVLGHRAFTGARLWAHADVVSAMRRQCAGCVDRLRRRLQAAAGDLGASPVQLPRHRLRGDQGRLGPFEWWRLQRADGISVTVLRLPAAPGSQDLICAHGLLWGEGPPDGRDADLERLAHSTTTLAALFGPGLRQWVPEQGPLLGAEAAAAQAAYWRHLLEVAARAVARGEVAAGDVPPEAAQDAATAAHPRHALNWQRAWRQAEEREFAPPQAQRPPAFQRSLR